MVREGRRVYVRMHGRSICDEELLRRAIAREHEFERTVQELERSASELKLRASEVELERDEARESASAGRRPYEELEETYRKETAAHKETKELLNMLCVTAVVLLVLLVVSVLVSWLVLT